MSDTEGRLDIIEQKLASFNERLVRIGDEVRTYKGRAAVYEELVQQHATLLALIQQSNAQTLKNIEELLVVQKVVLEKIAHLDSRWTSQAITVIASGVVAVASAAWVFITK